MLWQHCLETVHVQMEIRRRQTSISGLTYLNNFGTDARQPTCHTLCQHPLRWIRRPDAELNRLKLTIYNARWSVMLRCLPARFVPTQNISGFIFFSYFIMNKTTQFTFPGYVTATLNIYVIERRNSKNKCARPVSIIFTFRQNDSSDR